MGTCECRCDTCLDSDCEGHVCAPHEVGRWVVVSPRMAHPMPTDFETRDAAESFLAALPVSGLSVSQVPANP